MRTRDGDYMPLHAADRLPYDKQLLEDLAARAVSATEGSHATIRRDTGQGAQIHDFDVVDRDGHARPVEVTMVTNGAQLRRLAAIRKHRAGLRRLATRWTLLLELAPSVRISVLVRELPDLLDDLEADGVCHLDTQAAISRGSEVSAWLASLGVTRALGARAQGGHGELRLCHPPLGDSGSDPVTTAVQAVAWRRDNMAKLASAGGGDLFIWITDSHPAHSIIWDTDGITAHSRPKLPEPVRAVWAAWLFSHTHQAGDITASCHQLWRAANGAPWEDLTTQALKEPLMLRAPSGHARP